MESDHKSVAEDALALLLGCEGISTYFPTLWNPPSTVCPPGGKGGKIRLQSTSKILLTQTHFLVLHEGVWQAHQTTAALASPPPPHGNRLR